MPAERPVRAVFLGSGPFAVPIAEAVATDPALELVGVVSAPDRPAGRGDRSRAVPVARWVKEHDVPLLQPVRLREPSAQSEVLALHPGLLVLADYGQIVPQALLDGPLHGALNVHPSLLPRHRGASPVAATILAGDPETGVSVIRMNAGVDTGPIVGQARTDVLPGETAPELRARLADLGARLLSDVLEPWLARSIVPRPQPEEGITVTRPLRRDDGRLDWAQDAATLERQVRAFQPWPGSHAGTSVGRLVVWRAATRDAETSREADRRGLPVPGTVVAVDGDLAVACGSGLLELVEVQLAGRARMSGRDLRNGYPRLVGERLA